MPPSSCKTSHKISSISRNADESLELTFTNGITATVDALIGGDGVHSIVRQHVLSQYPNEVSPFFSKQYLYVTMAPMEKGKEKMEEWFPSMPIQYAWCGDQAFLMHDPANGGQTLQIMAAVQTDETWGDDQWTKEKTEKDLRRDMESFRGLGKVCADVR